jgi:hypothetical protein
VNTINNQKLSDEIKTIAKSGFDCYYLKSLTPDLLSKTLLIRAQNQQFCQLDEKHSLLCDEGEAPIPAAVRSKA